MPDGWERTKNGTLVRRCGPHTAIVEGCTWRIVGPKPLKSRGRLRTEAEAVESAELNLDYLTETGCCGA